MYNETIHICIVMNKLMTDNCLGHKIINSKLIKILFISVGCITSKNLNLGDDEYVAI